MQDEDSPSVCDMDLQALKIFPKHTNSTLLLSGARPNDDFGSAFVLAMCDTQSFSLIFATYIR